MHRIPKETTRTAATVQKRLAGRQQGDGDPSLPDWAWAEMQRLARQIGKARRRGWHRAARSLTEELSHAADNFHYRLLELLTSLREQASSPPPPNQAEIVQDLVALEKEFDDVELKPDTGEICVTVGPITFEDVPLGRFEIRLDWEGPRGTSPYRIVALEPNPAGGNDSVTHPHVQDECLCEGEGRAAIRAALAQGRLLDFFTIVSQTLSTYARGSAYVELDRWEGQSCQDCGATIWEDDRYYCQRCDAILCGECSLSCQECGDSYCAACIAACHECHDRYCSSCLKSCSECLEPTCSNCLQEGLCGSCHEKRQQERNDEDGSGDGPAYGANQHPAGSPDAKVWLQPVLEAECGSTSAEQSVAAV